jgi:hypothetical protein
MGREREGEEGKGREEGKKGKEERRGKEETEAEKRKRRGRKEESCWRTSDLPTWHSQPSADSD